MNVLEFSGIVYAISATAGFLGVADGPGRRRGGDSRAHAAARRGLRYAMGASLVSVIATSSGAAAAYVKEGFSNIRVGMFLEIATTLGAVAGAHLVACRPRFRRWRWCSARCCSIRRGLLSGSRVVPAAERPDPLADSCAG